MTGELRVWVTTAMVAGCSHVPAGPPQPTPPPADASLELVAGELGGWGTADAIGTSARFGNLGQLAIASARLYVPSHDVVRVIDLASAAVTTQPSAGGMDLFGVTSAEDGTLYAADDEAHAIFRLDPTTATWLPYASATFDAPAALAESAGTLYIADLADQTIRTLDLATGTAGTLVPAGVLDDPIGLAIAAGTLYVADRNASVIRSVDLATGTVALLAGQLGTAGGRDGDASVATFDHPQAIALDGHGSLWVSDGPSQTVRRIELATGNVTTPLGTYRVGGASDAAGAAASFNFVTGLAFDGTQLYLADSGNGEVRRADVTTLAVTTWAGSVAHPGTSDGAGGDARFNAPRGLALASDGTLYVADSQNAAIRRIDAGSGQVTTLQLSAAGLPRGLGYPVGLALGGDHTLIVSELTANDVVAIDLDSSTLTTVADTLHAPRALAFDGVDRVVVSDLDPETGTPELRIVALSAHTVATLALDATLGDVGGLAFAGETLFVADAKAGIVYRVDLSSGHADPIVSVPAPGALTYDGAATLYVACGDATVRAIAVATGTTTTLAGRAGEYGCEPGPLPGGLNGPAGLAGGGDQPLYISDLAESAILVAR